MTPVDPYLPAHAASRFVLERRVGQGGMGQVWLAMDRDWGSRVALKTASFVTPGSAAAMRTEFRAFAGIVHENVARFFELVGDEARCAYSMEFIDGASFIEYVRGDLPQGAPLGGAGLVRLMPLVGQLLAGVAAVHDAGLLHRDLKPANVLIDGAGRLVLVDPGLAVALADVGTSAPRAMVGTVAYMAPEQLEGEPLGPGTDWYAVGVMVFEALLGRVPFGGALLDVAAKKRLGVLPPLDGLPDGPEGVWAVALRLLLSPNPAERRRGVDQLREVTAHRMPRAFEASPYVGREVELERLDHLWASASGSRLIVVTGPTGYGKSRLLDTWAAGARRRLGARIVAGRCDPRESVPFLGLDALMRLVSPRLDAPPQQAPVTLEAQRRAFANFRSAFFAATDGAPTVVLVDDVQWAGPDTAVLLAELARAPVPANVLFVVSARSPEEVDPALAELAFDTLSLGRLAAEASLQLASWFASPRRAGLVSAVAAGDPLLLTELSRAGELGLSTSSPEVDGLVRNRIRGLPPTERALFEIIALAGSAVGPAVLRRCDIPDTLDAVTTLLRERLVRLESGPGGVTVSPAHATFAAAAAAELRPEARALRHEALAEALIGAGDPRSEFIAIHLELGGAPERAASYALTAAREAGRRFAYRSARELYERAFRLGPPVTGTRGEYAEILAALGLGQLAADVFLEVAGGESGDPRLVVRAAEQLFLSARVPSGMRLLAAVLRRVGVVAPRSRFFQLLGIAAGHFRLAWGWLPRTPDDLALTALWVAAAGVAPSDPILSHWYGARYALLALATNDAAAKARSASLEAILLARFRSTRFGDRAPVRLAEAFRLAELSGDPGEIAYAWVAAGAVHWTVQDVGPATAACERALDLYSRITSRSVHWEISVTRLWLHGSYAVSCEIEKMLRLADAVSEDAKARNDPWALDAGLFALVCRAHLIRGDVAAAEAEVRALEARVLEGGGCVGEVLIDEVEADLALLRGDVGEAWRAMVRGQPRRERHQTEVIPALAVDYYARRGSIAAALAAGRGEASAKERAAAAKVARGDRERLRRCPAINAVRTAELLDAHARLLGGAPLADVAASLDVIERDSAALGQHHWASAARALRLAAQGVRDTSWCGGLYVDLFVPGLVAVP
ncbi:hypothetical protein LBMAG42_38180 [Deltaproteobacteria bacterium]|nr:hypothetical protein LBMAG42_38180 [Deltaproteobacteria bacterium]